MMIDSQDRSIHKVDRFRSHIFSHVRVEQDDDGALYYLLDDTPTTVFWMDYVATRWYRALEFCGSFCSKSTPAIDIWSIGCIFAEVLTGKPLFPRKSVVHQLELITDLLGTPKSETIAGFRNEKLENTWVK